jgi:hypothetical protein
LWFIGGEFNYHQQYIRNSCANACANELDENAPELKACFS